MNTYKQHCTKGPAEAFGRRVRTADGKEIALCNSATDSQGVSQSTLKREEADAKLIAETFSVLHETGMTPRELVKALRKLYDAASCIDGILDGDRDKQEAWEGEVSELDRARAEANLILSHQPVIPV